MFTVTPDVLLKTSIMRAFHENLLIALDRAENEEVIFGALLRSAQALGFEHLAYGMRLATPVSNPKVITHSNYPEAWQQRYQEAGYLAVDPSVARCQRTRDPLLWDDALFAAAKAFWSEARGQGLRVGWAQSSLDGAGVGGMLTLSRSRESLTPIELRSKEAEMRWLVQSAHLALSRFLTPQATAEPAAPLSRREVELLKWSADGKTAQEISDLLSISVATANFHLKNAIFKMGAANKTSAVVRALMAGLLN